MKILKVTIHEIYPPEEDYEYCVEYRWEFRWRSARIVSNSTLLTKASAKESVRNWIRSYMTAKKPVKIKFITNTRSNIELIV